MSLAANNHYVTRSYLDRFSLNGWVQVYRILVPNNAFPLWESFSPAQIGKMKHLYTRVETGEESDELEHWFNREVEDPANRVISAAVNGEKLNREDWRVLVRFLAAQDVRTPSYFQRFLVQSNSLIPKILEDTLDDVREQLETGMKPRLHQAANVTAEVLPFPMRIHTEQTPADKMLVQLEVLGGRSMWLTEIHRLLTSTWEVLTQHKWTILRPAAGLKWFTTDNPVLKLNMQDLSCYNFGGGWNSRNTEIMMPLDPEHLLYTRIGSPRVQRGHELTPAQTTLIQRLLAEHAHRFVYASANHHSMAQVRRRVINLAAFKNEERAMGDFHSVQTDAEWEMMTRPKSLSIGALP